MNLDTRSAHQFQRLGTHIERPHVVIEHTHLHALTGLLNEQIDEFTAHLVFLDDEILHMDEAVSILNVAFQGIKLGLTTSEGLNVIANKGVGLGQFIDQ